MLQSQRRRRWRNSAKGFVLIVMILILLAQPFFGCLNKHRCQGCSWPVGRKYKSKFIMDCGFQLPHNNIAATIRFCGKWISNRNADSVFDKFIHRNRRCLKLRFIINSRCCKKLVNPHPADRALRQADQGLTSKIRQAYLLLLGQFMRLMQNADTRENGQYEPYVRLDR